MIKKVIILAVFTLFSNPFIIQFSTTNAIQKAILIPCVFAEYHQINSINPIQLEQQLILTRCGF